MLVTMGSSPVESVVAAGNIFVGYVSCNIKKKKQNKTALKWTLFPQSRIKMYDGFISFSVEDSMAK